MAAVIHITADEINHLIHAYLQDSGFEHSAFALRNEGRLERSSHFNDHIPRGELVELMTKALLYIEVETHWRGDSINTECKSPFSLLQKHECSSNIIGLNEALTLPEEAAYHTTIVQKRKANTPAPNDERSEKRIRRTADPDMLDEFSYLPELLVKDKDTKSNYLPYDDRLSASPSTSVIDDSGKTNLSGRISGSASQNVEPNAVSQLTGHSAEVFVCAWNPALSDVLATGSKDATVRIWNLGAKEDSQPIVLQHLPISEQRDITSLDWNSDGTLLATGSYDSVLRVWTASDIGLSGVAVAHLLFIDEKGPIFATRFSKSGRWLLSASLDGTACVWDVVEKKLYMQFRCHAECCLDVDWLDDTTFASCGADKMIHIMQLGNSHPIRTLEGHTHEVNQIKFNPSRTRLASCSDDQTARIWNLANILRTQESESIPGLGTISNETVIILEGHSDSIGSIGWCPTTPEGESELLATTSFDGTARLWNVDTGECLQAISDHTRAAYTLAFSPGGKYFATGSGDGWLYIYSIETKQKIWSWYAGSDKPGIYEVDWQKAGGADRIALCLESKAVGIVDVTKIPALVG